MKTGTIIAIVVAVVLVVGVVAWAGARYRHGCGWSGGSSAPYSHARGWQQPPTTSPRADQPIYHNRRCGHWWGWLAPWHCDWRTEYRGGCC